METCSSSRGPSGGRIDGSRAAIIDLPAPGRPTEQQVVAACSRDLQGALGALLALDVGEVWQRQDRLRDPRLRPREDLRALEMVGELDERQGRQHLDLTARPGGLRPAGGGTDEAVPATIRGDRCRQDTGDGCQRVPSSASSPSAVKLSSASGGIAPMAAMMPSAMGRS